MQSKNYFGLLFFKSSLPYLVKLYYTFENKIRIGFLTCFYIYIYILIALYTPIRSYSFKDISIYSLHDHVSHVEFYFYLQALSLKPVFLISFPACPAAVYACRNHTLTDVGKEKLSKQMYNRLILNRTKFASLITQCFSQFE